MDQETPESEKTTKDHSDSSSGSQKVDTSGMDKAACDKRRSEVIDDMAEIKRQFIQLEQQLYLDKEKQIEAKIEEVKLGRAPEFLKPLEVLENNMRTRIEIAGTLREVKLRNINTKYDAEKVAALQDFENERELLRDSMRCELEEEIRRLEEDHIRAEVASEISTEQATHKKSIRKTDPMSTTGETKNPATASGPYIVYMLHEEEIIEDLTAIRTALKVKEQKDDNPV